MSEMIDVLTIAALALFGCVMGSFAGATIWRLRALQLREDKAAGEDIDDKELRRLRPLLKKSPTNDRSQCLHCHHVLAWYDLLPLISWIQLRGKCRYCKQPIGYFEPIMEIGVAVFFVASYVFWPYGELQTLLEILKFGIWLVSGVLLAILFGYDTKWFLLPNKIVFPLIALGTANVAVTALITGDPILVLMSSAAAAIVLSGLYYVLYIISRGAWVGFGDIKLGLGLALLLADWKLALLALFAANVVGCLVVLPGLLSRKLSRKAHVPFGPMLIVGWFIAGIFGQVIIDWYVGIMAI